MSVLGFLLGSEPLAQAVRGFRGNPVVHRFSPSRMSLPRRVMWLLMLLVPWLGAAVATVVLARVIAGANARDALQACVSPMAMAAFGYFALLQTTLPFVLFQGQVPGEHELRDLATTRLTREEVLLGFLFWPAVAGFAPMVPIAIVEGIQFALLSIESLRATATTSGQFASVASDVAPVLIGVIWIGCASMVLVCGAAASSRRSRAFLLLIGPLVLCPLAIQILTTYSVAFSLAIAWFPSLPTAPAPGWGASVAATAWGYGLTIFWVSVSLVLLSRMSFAEATQRFWRKLEEDPAVNGTAWARERLFLATPANRLLLGEAAGGCLRRFRRQAQRSLVFALCWAVGAMAIALGLLLTLEQPYSLNVAERIEFVRVAAPLIAFGFPIQSLVLPIAVIHWALRVAPDAGMGRENLVVAEAPLSWGGRLLAGLLVPMAPAFIFTFNAATVNTVSGYKSVPVAIADLACSLATSLILAWAALVSIAWTGGKGWTRKAFFLLASIMVTAAAPLHARYILPSHPWFESWDRVSSFLLLQVVALGVPWLLLDSAPRAARRIRDRIAATNVEPA